MMSSIPVKLEKKDNDRQALRVGMIAELDAVSLYEQIAAQVSDPAVKRIFLDIAREEKTHMGEFETLLLKLDAEQAQELENAVKEVKEKSGH